MDILSYFEIEDAKRGPKHLIQLLNEVPHEDIVTTSEAVCAIVSFEKQSRIKYLEDGEWI